MASVAICTAVWKPNVTSVPSMSLSMVLGTPTIGQAELLVEQRAATVSVPLPPITIRPSRPDVLEGLLHLGQAVRVVERTARAGCRAACRPWAACPAASATSRGIVAPLDHAVPGVEEAEHLVAVAVSPLRTMARITAFRPGQSPPPVSTPLARSHASTRPPTYR